jgi:type I restriction enzyme R subunit
LRAELEALTAKTAQAKAALTQQPTEAERTHTSTFEKYRAAAQVASQQVYLDEATTRQLIDAQLRQARWKADTVKMCYHNGTRPEHGHNRAIAEWPTASGRGAG